MQWSVRDLLEMHWIKTQDVACSVYTTVINHRQKSSFHKFFHGIKSKASLINEVEEAKFPIDWQYVHWIKAYHVSIYPKYSHEPLSIHWPFQYFSVYHCLWTYCFHVSNPALLIGVKLHNALVYFILNRPKGDYLLNSAVAWQDNLFKPHIKKQFSAEKLLKQGDGFLIGLLAKQLGTGKQPTSCHAVMWPKKVVVFFPDYGLSTMCGGCLHKLQQR